MNVTLRQLKAFLIGTECSSFSEAAEKALLTQPGYSLMIRQLEAELGVKLFDRNTRRVEITRSGAELKRRLQPILLNLEETLEDARHATSRKRGRVTIGLVPSVSTTVLGKIAATLSRQAPDIILTVKEELSGQLIDMVADSAVDLAVGVDVNPSATVSFTPLIHDRMVGIFHPDDPVLEKETIDWGCLSGRPYIAFGLSSVQLCVEKAFARAGVTVVPSLDVKFVATAASLVRERMGYTVLPELALQLTDLNGLAIRPIVPSVGRQVGVLIHAQKSLSPAAALVFDIVVEALSALNLGEIHPPVEAAGIMPEL